MASTCLGCNLGVLICCQTKSQAVFLQQVKEVSAGASAQGSEVGLHRLWMGKKNKSERENAVWLVLYTCGLADRKRLLHSLGRGFNLCVFCQLSKKSIGTKCLYP